MEKLHRDITFFLALASFLLLVACNVNTKENDWAKFNLNGKVKFIKESSFKAIDRFGEIELGDKEWDNTSTYNVEINSIKWDHIFKKDRLIKFNRIGNIIEKNLYFPNGTLIEKGIFKYNDKGWLIKKNVYFKDGSLEGTTSYEYNENGNIISEYRNGVVGTNVKCKYDNKGNMIEEVSLWGGKQTYKYNDEGKVIEKKEHSRDEYYMWIYTYDNIGYIKSSKEYGYDGKLNGYETYEYDSNENIKKNFEYYRDGELLSIITFEYDFDKKGNWIRRISYRENPPKIKNPRYIVKREIVYYDN